MKFTCTKTHLVRGVALAEKIPGRNMSLPILENILIRTESPHKLNIISTDLELGVSCWIPAKIEEEGEHALPLSLVSGLLQSLPEGNIEARAQKQALSIKAGSVASKIHGEDPSQFPRFPHIKKENPVIVPASMFARALSAVAGSVSLQETKPELTGVYLSLSPKEIICAATDTFRLAEKRISSQTDVFFKEGSYQIILPIKTAHEIIRIFAQDESGTPLFCYIGDGQMLFAYESDGRSVIPEVHITSRVIEGEYPDYQQIIPTSSSADVLINKQDILGALKSSVLFANRLREVSLSFSPQKGTCVVDTKNQDKGEYTATLACGGTGEDVRVVLNHQYLIDGIANSGEGDVRIRIQDSLKPVLLTSSIENVPYKYVVMPIRKDD